VFAISIGIVGRELCDRRQGGTRPSMTKLRLQFSAGPQMLRVTPVMKAGTQGLLQSFIARSLQRVRQQHLARTDCEQCSGDPARGTRGRIHGSKDRRLLLAWSSRLKNAQRSVDLSHLTTATTDLHRNSSTRAF
jgi:hypothetical protein